MHQSLTSSQFFFGDQPLKILITKSIKRGLDGQKFGGPLSEGAIGDEIDSSDEKPKIKEDFRQKASQRWKI